MKFLTILAAMSSLFIFESALARTRSLSVSEMQAHCRNNTRPAGLDAANRAALERNCQIWRNSGALTGAANPTPAPVPASTPARSLPQAETPAPVADAAPAAATPAQEPITGTGGQVQSGPNVCNDSALTSEIPSGQSSAPQIPSGEEEYHSYVRQQILSGNIPSHLRNLAPVRMSGGSCHGASEITFCTMTQPIAIGGDNNFHYANLRINDAIAVARELGMILPTSHMVDAIHQAATVRISSLTRPWFCNRADGGDCTAHLPYRFREQGDALRGRVLGHGSYQPGAIVSGTHKDYALSHRLTPNGSGGVTNMSLYGWNGIQSRRDRIQHDSSHIDYSQSPRFVSQWVAVGGTWRRMSDLLTNPGCAAMINGGNQIGSNISSLFDNPDLQTPGRGGQVDPQTTPAVDVGV